MALVPYKETKNFYVQNFAYAIIQETNMRTFIS